MKNILTVAKYELLHYFVSPVAYVYLISFLLLNGSFAFYFGDFFNRGEANLISMFTYQPWLYLLFIPGISMRLWCEEFRNKTVIQLITMPISTGQLVYGKFFAAWIFCGLALVLTFTFWLTVNMLGQPDNQVILLGYIASFVLAGCMLAISETISALTKNQVVALVLSVIANLFFFWSGIEYILSFCRLLFSDTIIDVIASFSFLSHFNSLTHGLLELRDVLFFSSLIIFCNYTTILIVNFKTAGTCHYIHSNHKSYVLACWMCLFISFLGINILANGLTRKYQYDATQENIFTLSPASKNILQNLSEPVLAKLYFSPILEQRNAEMRQQFDNIRILLQKYKDASGGNFDFKVYYPKFLSNEEDIAIANGIQPVPLVDLNQNALFGLTLEDTLQNVQTIPFFAISQNDRLEQEITSKIYQLNHQKKTIGLISTIPVLGSSEQSNIVISEPWETFKILNENYNVLNISNPEDLSTEKVDAVILMHPRNLSPEMVTAIATYSHQGGKFLVLLDPADEAARLYSITTNRLQSSDLGPLEQLWNIHFYKDYVVADLQNSITVDATIDYKENPVFSQDIIQFRLQAEDMNPNHPITQNLNEIMLASTSIVMPDTDAYNSGKIKFYPLMRASNISSLMTAKVVIDGLNPQNILKYFNADDNQKFVAAEVIGMEQNNPFNLIVVADSDFLYDAFWMEKINFMEQSYTSNLYDNANFLLNAIDYLTDDTSLIELRGKKTKRRPFYNVELTRRLNSFQYKIKEQSIFEHIDEAKRTLQEVWNKRDFEERSNFTADELAVIAKIRQQLNDFRQQLSDLRYQAYTDITRLDNLLKFINIWLIPLIFGIFLLLRFLWLSILKNRAQHLSLAIKLDFDFLKLFGICIIIFTAGIIVTYYLNRSSIDSYEGKVAFPEIIKHINDIDKIELKNHDESLTFQKEDGMWILRETPDLPVYQERIRRLLATAAGAKFFAKKSDKAQNLAFFNLLPIENKDSKSVHLAFKNDDRELQSFILGNINIDLGRGGTAAYMRFDNQFQVWEIEADFVDMNLDWHAWTYSNLWDLRYGRLYASSGQAEDEKVLMYLMKLLLNTPIISISNKPQANPIITYKLYVEGGDYVDLNFFTEGDKAFVTYIFDKNNVNPHLKILAQYIGDKAVQIDKEKMEKILDIIR